jgi:protein SCO1/2
MNRQPFAHHLKGAGAAAAPRASTPGARSWGARLLGVILAAALFVSGCGADPYTFHGTAYNPIIPAPRLQGVQAGGETFDLQALPEKVKLVFFGYTFCPDICPFTLANIKSVYEQLPPYQQQEVAAVFVSVDPQRDTPELLGEYVDAFNPAFYGVHVPAEELETIKQGYGVFAQKSTVAAAESAAGYLVDHTAVVYLVDKDDNLRAIYPSDAPPADIAADVRHLLD